jgi:hypothetical protein
MVINKLELGNISESLFHSESIFDDGDDNYIISGAHAEFFHHKHEASAKNSGDQLYMVGGHWSQHQHI